MTSPFQEFTSTYEAFRKKLPRHPLNEELRSRILQGSFPSNDWLKSRTRKMMDIMSPLWMRSDMVFTDRDELDSLDAPAS